MTLSIVASNPITKELCVATMTFLVAVGDVVPMVIPDVGSIAVQAKVKPSNRFKILDSASCLDCYSYIDNWNIVFTNNQIYVNLDSSIFLSDEIDLFNM